MVQLSVISATAGLFATLISAFPVPPAKHPRAEIVSFTNKHVTARHSESYSLMDSIARDLDRIQRRKALSERPRGAQKVKRTAAALEPFDINRYRQLMKRQGSTYEPMVNAKNDSLYYGNMDIGTPAQTTNFQFDTGSSDMLVVSSDCKNCTGPFFDPSQSSTFVDTQQDFVTSFVDGSFTTGTVSTDIVSMGSLTVQTQAFALVTQASEGFDGPNAGLIGLGFESEAQSKATPWFINLANAGALESNIFSFYMSRESAEGSELCVGCYDSSKFSGDIEYFPLYPGGSSQKNWDITAQGLTVGGQVVTSNFTATIDSGTSKIIVPPSVAEALYSQIPGAEPEDGVYVVPCSSAPSLEVGISFSSATVFNIAPSELVVSTPVDSGSDKCIALIISSGSEDGMVLIGDTFISSWYSVFDYGNQKIGFAKAN